MSRDETLVASSARNREVQAIRDQNAEWWDRRGEPDVLVGELQGDSPRAGGADALVLGSTAGGVRGRA